MRYKKQEIVIGKDGQKKLCAKNVLIVGVGALGSVVAELLVRGGVGNVFLLDGDLVELSNLQRQSLYNEDDASQSTPKVIALKEHLSKINSSINIIPLFNELSVDNAMDIIENMDLVIDGTDNNRARRLINDVCFFKGIPWLHGAASGTIASYFAFVPGKTPCYKCLKGEELTEGLNCDVNGVLASTSHLVASLQFSEAIKILTGNLHLLKKTFQHIDMWRNENLNLKFSIRKGCSCQTEDRQLDFYPTTHESYKIKMLCGKEVIEVKFFDEKGDLKSDNSNLISNLARTGVQVFKSPYFQTVSYNNQKVRFLNDGRIYIYSNSIDETEAVVKEWLQYK